jgi:3-oxoacyl-[acyl-carrier-protein] synthase-3
MKTMKTTADLLTAYLLGRVDLVLRNMGQADLASTGPQTRFGDLLDSMGMVEFLAIVGNDCGTTPEALEDCVGGRFGTVAELAATMLAAGLGLHHPGGPVARELGGPEPAGSGPSASARCWLAATAIQLPARVQAAQEINQALNRPAGWFESHAGIEQRCVWGDQDPLQAAATAAGSCLDRAGLAVEEVGALLVTAEAPPVLTGLAAALHHRQDLRPTTAALEIGGACTGFLAGLWLAQALLPRAGAVLLLGVEAPTRFLPLRPGPAGEAAALFGDAAAACLLCDRPAGEASVPLKGLVLGADGGKARLLRVEPSGAGGVEVQMEGSRLALEAVRAMARSVRELAEDYGLKAADVRAVVAHGGNGRFPALLARQLGLPPERVWSETYRTGNLGSASLPVAWAAHPVPGAGPVLWTAAGAGLTWGAALWGQGEGAEGG